jgi:hypothetical protein
MDIDGARLRRPLLDARRPARTPTGRSSGGWRPLDATARYDDARRLAFDSGRSTDAPAATRAADPSSARRWPWRSTGGVEELLADIDPAAIASSTYARLWGEFHAWLRVRDRRCRRG